MRFHVEHSTSPEDLACYGYDASGLRGKPSIVVWPRSAGDVSEAVKHALFRGISIVPRGAGTGMTGGSVPNDGAMVLSFEKMNRIVDIDTDNMCAVVEPGVVNGALQKELEASGFFYPPDPASLDFCTIGGNVAENAGGPRALKYGVTREYVMQIEAVLPDGSTITTGVGTKKGVVGYDLTRLLVGSEGTLAAFTKIRLGILPLPQSVLTMLVLFRDLESSGRAVSKITASGIIPRTLEFMDREAVHAVESFKPSGLPLGMEALLLIELDGHESSIKSEAGRISDICSSLGGDVREARDDTERALLWEARRAVSPALYHLYPTKINEDVVVPRDRIADALSSLRKLSDSSGIKIVNFGHAGDGNIHVNVMVDKKDKPAVEKAQRLVKEIFRTVLAMGGTISGEHGVGLTKASYIGMEIAEKELALMKSIKGVFDPKNVLNPGKIF